MSRYLMIRPILILGLVASVAEAQAPAKPEGRQYKVAFWYELDRPFTSVQYRTYDLARGQFDRLAVDGWVRTILEKHPRYGATVRDLSTAGEPGDTEAERLVGAIEREKRRWVNLNARPMTSISRLVGPAPDSRKDRDVGRASFDLPAPGSPGLIANPPTSPFPYPYRSGPR